MVILKRVLALVLLTVISADAQTSATYRTRLAEVEKNARDIAIQKAGLEELIATTPAKVVQLDECTEQLQTLLSELATINQNNLLKLLLRLSYEVYNTVDGAAGTTKTAVESFVNLGIHYTLGRMAFETAGAEGQKALGLDSNNYLSSRNAAVRRVSEAAMNEINEVAKINVALNRDLDYYRALVQAEQGSDPGETGAILRKNLVVREKIGLGIEALARLRGTALSQVVVAEIDLEWLEAEAQSIASLHDGVKLQLETALAQELEAAITAGVSNLQSNIVEPPDPEPFTFSYPPNDPEHPDPNYHHDYYTTRYNAGATRIRNKLSASVPVLLSQFQSWTNDFEHSVTNNASTLLWVKEQVREWETKDQLPADALRAWHEAYYDLDYVKTTIEELLQKKQKLASSATSLETLETQLINFNNLKRTTKGLNEIAQASGYTASEPVQDGQTPRPVLGIYSLDHYLAEQGIIALAWGPESLATLPTPLNFAAFFTYKEEISALDPQIDQSLKNLGQAKQSLENHISGLQNAYIAGLASVRTQQELLSYQTSALVQALESAERLSGNKPYCAFSAMVEYLEIHTNFWNKVQLSEALATALQNNAGAGAARSVWESYRNYIPAYQTIDRKYHTAASDIVRNFDNSSAITMLRMDMEAAHDAADLLKMPTPEPSVESAKLVEGRYYEAHHTSREVRNRESARNLPECALLEPMPQDSGATNAHLVDPLVVALPVYGLVVIQEEMDRQFQTLMDKPNRDEPAMWETVTTIARAVDQWKLAHTNVMLAYNFHNTANRIKDQKLYEARMAWEAAFAAPIITSWPNYIGIPPNQQGELTVQFESHKPVTCTWYRDNWFEEDEQVGTGLALRLSAPAGLEQYYCVIANVFGQAQSGRIDVVPAQGPQIAEQPQNLTAEPGGQAQLTTGLYLTSAYIEQTGQWFVSLTEDQNSSFRAIPGATGTTLNIKSVIASRWYYYDAQNPWGTTRSALAKVTSTHDQKPLLLTKGPLVAYLGIPFTYQLDGAYSTGFELLGTPPNWLNLDRKTGVLRGTPAGTAGTMTCTAKAVQENGAVTNKSGTVALEIQIKTREEWEGPIALRYFTPEQAVEPTVGGDEADPDNDGIPNKTEYALGLCPTCPDAKETKPWFLINGSQATIMLERTQQRHHTPYNVESSTGLGAWQPLSITDNIIETQNGRESVSYSTGTTNRGFFRLKTL